MIRIRHSVLLAAWALVLAAFPVHARVSFGGLDLNERNELLFSVSQSIPGTPVYSSVFMSRLGKNKVEGSPQIITCFPERMELLHGGKTLQLRNRYGTAWYSVQEKKLRWVSSAGSVPVDYARTASQSVSADGKWICFVRQTKNAAGQLILQNALTGSQQVIVESSPFGYDGVNVRWAPDSSVLIYEKKGGIYFLTPEEAFKNVHVPEEYRRIGDGTINSAVWTRSGDLIYIDGDIVWRIRKNELYTRGLYHALVGSGTMLGRLPGMFDSPHDKFWASSDGNQIVVIKSDRLVSWYSVNSGGYDFLRINSIFPLTGIKGSPLEYFVFWTADDVPVLWISMLSYATGKRSGAVYRLGASMDLMLEVEGSSFPALSPDARHVAFTGGKSLYVYDVTTWRQAGRLSGEQMASFVWAADDTLYAGGYQTVSLWRLDYDAKSSPAGTAETVLLSSSDNFWWADGRILSSAGAQGNIYEYISERNSWKPCTAQAAPRDARSEKNGKFRVFIGDAQNKRFDNAVYVRSLSGNVITYPVFAETDVSVPEPKKAAFVFDAMDNAEGVARILYVLDEFNLRGTFFLNGEFIRRYPMETNQIVKAGSECASSFYSAADLTQKSFVIDSDFIKRGLARNEDEFFSATGHELSLLWHAPWYKDSALMRRAGEEAGYRYVDAFTKFSDRVNFEQGIKSAGKSVYMDAGQLIDALVHDLHDGMIIPVSAGKTSGTRQDYLYEKLDILMSAVLDAGYEIVSARDLAR